MYDYFQGALAFIFRHVIIGMLPLLMISFFALSCSAGTTEEIASLLNFVEQSKCTFIRNGKEYDSFEARQHIEKKYNYYKERISSVEDFIRYAAEKSSITGKPYRVLCDGVHMNSSDWLNAELDEVRVR